MPIPEEHSGRFVYHFSHIDNLSSLLRDGLLANNHPNFPNRNRSIAAEGIQARRAHMKVPCGPGGCVHDYVPLYFGSVSPMLLAVINAKNIDQFEILYFEFPIDLVERVGAVFTDSSANRDFPPAFFDDAADLGELDWEAIDSKKWSARDEWGNVDEAFKQRRMAELLIHDRLSVTEASRCVVWNNDVKKRVEDIVGDRPFPSIEFQDKWNRPHWFTNFAVGGSSSLVKGPNEIAAIFEATCEYVKANTGKHSSTAKFRRLKHLLAGLRVDFGCLPQTAELVGLQSANGIHKRTVDLHSQDVVEQLLQLEEFEAFEPRQQKLLEIAAYLHDIGKGPRSRWDQKGGVQQVDPDHPVGAMPMMAEILTEHVEKVTDSLARVLLKLVCYHDLVGDVLGKGRDEMQILDVVDSKDELKMLFALGKADVLALMPHWWDDEQAQELYDRCADAIDSEP